MHVKKNAPEVRKAYADAVLTVSSGDERKITGIASTPRPDRVGDVVIPSGAKFVCPFPLLLQHDHDKPLGEVTSFQVTPTGISIEATIAPAGVDKYIDRAYRRIKAGLIKGLSIGFRVLEWDLTPDGGLIIKSYEVYELSAVTVPCNADAVITDVKAVTPAGEVPSDPAALAAEVPVVKTPRSVAIDLSIRLYK